MLKKFQSENPFCQHLVYSAQKLIICFGSKCFYSVNLDLFYKISKLRETYVTDTLPKVPIYKTEITTMPFTR